MYSTTTVCYKYGNKLTYHFWHTGILLNSAWAWSVRIPPRIRGLHKSCLVIPCSFSYQYYPPRNPYRIVWYQYVNRGYPLVFDGWNPTSVIDRYKGRTMLYNKEYRDCSLLIKDLSFSHNGDRIYTWIDPENVGKGTFRFYDVTTLIQVDCKCYILSTFFFKVANFFFFFKLWSFARVNI